MLKMPFFQNFEGLQVLYQFSSMRSLNGFKPSGITMCDFHINMKIDKTQITFVLCSFLSY
jgi:hypothetical protein